MNDQFVNVESVLTLTSSRSVKIFEYGLNILLTTSALQKPVTKLVESLTCGRQDWKNNTVTYVNSGHKHRTRTCG